MKKTYIIAACLLLLLTIGIGYYLTDKQEEPMPQANINECSNINIANVKANAQTIENGKASYKTETKDILDKSSEGGQQTNYKSGDKTVLIKQDFYGETGKSEASYYLENGKVYYVNKKNSEYANPLSQDSSGEVKSVEEKEYYLGSSQNLCSWYSNQVQQPNSKDAEELIEFLISGL
jgi:hypothetical protein